MLKEATSGWDISYDNCICGLTGHCEKCKPWHLTEAMEHIDTIIINQDWTISR